MWADSSSWGKLASSPGQEPGNEASLPHDEETAFGIIIFFQFVGQRHQGDPQVDVGRGWDQRVGCCSLGSRAEILQSSTVTFIVEAN